MQNQDMHFYKQEVVFAAMSDPANVNRQTEYDRTA